MPGTPHRGNFFARRLDVGLNLFITEMGVLFSHPSERPLEPLPKLLAFLLPSTKRPKQRGAVPWHDKVIIRQARGDGVTAETWLTSMEECCQFSASVSEGCLVAKVHGDQAATDVRGELDKHGFVLGASRDGRADMAGGDEDRIGRAVLQGSAIEILRQ